MTGEPPDHAIDWKGNDWTPASDSPAAHPERPVHDARRRSAPSIAPEWEDPDGVPIDAFLFGGRRATVVPLVGGGLRLGARRRSSARRCRSRRPRPPPARSGQLRFDPMAMLPFCGYNMADYFGHWLQMGERDGAKLPRVFLVNWFRKDADGKFIWPGFGENSRVLEWVFRRCEGEGETVETAIGLRARRSATSTRGPQIRASGDGGAADGSTARPCAEQLPQVEELLAKFGDDLPEGVRPSSQALKQRLG